MFSKYLLRKEKKWEEVGRKEREEERRKKNKWDPGPKGRKFAPVMLHTGSRMTILKHKYCTDFNDTMSPLKKCK